LKFELGPLDGKSKIGVVDANRFLHAHCGGNGASVVVAGKVVRKVKEEEKRLRRWAGWHWSTDNHISSPSPYAPEELEDKLQVGGGKDAGNCQW